MGLKDCFYKKSSQDYNPDWILQKAGYNSLNYQESLKSQKVPLYSEIGRESQEMKKTFILLKNQTVNAKYNNNDKNELKNIDEL